MPLFLQSFAGLKTVINAVQGEDGSPSPHIPRRHHRSVVPEDAGDTEHIDNIRNSADADGGDDRNSVE